MYAIQLQSYTRIQKPRILRIEAKAKARSEMKKEKKENRVVRRGRPILGAGIPFAPHCLPPIGGGSDWMEGKWLGALGAWALRCRRPSWSHPTLFCYMLYALLLLFQQQLHTTHYIHTYMVPHPPSTKSDRSSPSGNGHSFSSSSCSHYIHSSPSGVLSCLLSVSSAARSTFLKFALILYVSLST